MKKNSKYEETFEAFTKKLDSAKKEPVDFSFYPYSSLSNVFHLNKLLSGHLDRFEELFVGKTLLDIGTADGDMALYANEIGAKHITVIEHSPTNFNNLKGLYFLKEYFKSNMDIIECDIDSQQWPDIEPVDFAFFLGILYHLKNPIHCLESLARVTKSAVFSSRVFDKMPNVRGFTFSEDQLAYLWRPAEVNNDDTNWWCFTENGMKLALERSGWKIIKTARVDSSVGTAEPIGMEKDGRFFIYAESIIA